MEQNKADLSLVPIKDLLNEVSSRCIAFVYAYRIRGNVEEKEILIIERGSGRWDESCALSNILNNHVLNNWNNELEKIQRFIEREENAD